MIRHLRRAWTRLRGRTEAHEQDLRDELESHLQLATDDNVRTGMSPEEARRAAVLQLGSLEATREAVRDARGVPALDDLGRDVRLAFRQIARRPVFGATAVAVLALGLGSSAALFTFVDAALLRPLPFADPTRLVRPYESIDSCPRCNLSYLDFKDWRDQNRVFSSMDLFRRNTGALTTPGGREAVTGGRVTAGFFGTLGVAPALGRDFAAGEDTAGASAVTILSDRAWRERFGGDPAAVGRAVEIDGVSHTVIGVMPASFAFAPLEPVEFWLPLTGTDSCSTRRSCHNLYAVARLRPGVTMEAALADIRVIAARLEQLYPESNRGQGAALTTLAESITGQVRPVLLLLLAGALLLFFIAAFNVTGLLVVRAESRRRELAVRTAMGASPARLLAQFAIEAWVVVASGGVLGLGLAFALAKVLVRLVPISLRPALPFFQDLALRPRVLAFAVALALGAFVLFTAAPWILVRRRPLDGLAGGRGSSGTVWRRIGSRLVVAELATALVLMVGAGLLGRSLVRLLQVDLGLRPEGLLVVEVGAPAAEVATDERAAALVQRVRDEVGAVPGVASVDLTSVAPVGTNANTRWFRVKGREYTGGAHDESPARSVSAAYFSTIGASLMAGRAFDERDAPGRPRVAIVSATLARHLFAAGDPVGHRISFVNGSKEEIEIVGVVGDVREEALDVAQRGTLYLPMAQDASTFFSVMARLSDPAHDPWPSLVPALRRANPDILIRDHTPMTARIADSPAVYLKRSVAWLAAVFGGVALLLSAVGLHGVIAYSVGQRTKEIGIRMALGAQSATVQRLVLREAAVVVGAGIALGIAGAVLGSRFLESLLFGVRPFDATVLATMTALLAAVAFLAVAAPARRAASVHPMEALRTD